MGGEDEARASKPLNLPSLEWFLARGTRTGSTSKAEFCVFLQQKSICDANYGSSSFCISLHQQLPL